MSIETLVKAAQMPAIDVTGVWDTYNSMVSRSRAERQKLQRELAAAGDGTLIDVMDLFSLKEAWGTDGFPLIALAPIDESTIYFQQQPYEFTRFCTGKRDKNHNKMKLSRQLRIYGYHDLGRGCTGSARVPLIPKSVAPNVLKRMTRDHWIMFDTPSWDNKKVIPFDPYLLQRLDKKRFKVLAHWDLTAKERQLMALLG